MGFNQSAVKAATKAFLDTVEYLEQAKASESHSIEHENVEKDQSLDDENGPEYGGAVVGDLIQWEIQGILQMPKPLRVRAISPDGQWVAVEGSKTGIPMSQVIVEEKPAPVAYTFSFPEPESFTQEEELEDGEIEWIRNPVGKGTAVRVLVTGDMGPKEIGKLIKLLEAQKLVLEDD
ncbi:MAG: hypothetical protein ABNH53_07210 [Henriciella sp.]|jgi:hypothetical protein